MHMDAGEIERSLVEQSAAGDGPGLVGPVPQRRVLDPGVQLIQFSKRDIPVKDAS